MCYEIMHHDYSDEHFLLQVVFDEYPVMIFFVTFLFLTSIAHSAKDVVRMDLA